MLGISALRLGVPGVLLHGAAVAAIASHATAPPLTAQEAAPVHARVTGLAYDSIAARPLAQAIVRLVPVRDPAAARIATADSLGRFSLDSVGAGGWLATALHPALDSLGIEPPVARLDIREPGELALTLATPSARTLIAQRCGALDPELGLLYGTVRSARDESPASFAWLALEWPEWVIPARGRGLRSELVRRVVQGDSLGRYAACGVPADGAVRAVAWQGADSTGAVRVTIAAGGLARRDFSVAPAGGARGAPALAQTPGDSAIRLGEAAVHGRATDINGRAVAGAVARVMGSGDAVRTADDGSFEVRRAVAGSQTLEVRAIGFEPARHDVELRDGATLEVAVMLAPQRVQLDTVRVTADRPPNPALNGFERRWRSGAGGTFIDGATVRDWSTVFVSDALRRVNGVFVQSVGGYGQRLLMRDQGGRLCAPLVMVDGVPVPLGGGMAESFLDDFVSQSEVAALEVYPRGGVTPAEFQNASGCGAVAVWTYTRFGGVSPRRPQGW